MVKASAMGVGFPIAYLFLEVGRANGLILRNAAVRSFLQAVSNVSPQLRPNCSFTDKERSQINAIQNSFIVTPSFCLWHLKQAIKEKMSEMKNLTSPQWASRRNALLNVLWTFTNFAHHYVPIYLAIACERWRLKS